MNYFELKKACKKIYQKIKKDAEVDLWSFEEIKNPLNCKEELKKIIESELTSYDIDFKNRILSEFLNDGPLDKLLQDENITEVIVNSPSHIWYEKQGQLHKHTECFLSELTYNNFISRLCMEAKKEITLDTPFTDGSWRNFRLHIIAPPLTENNTHLTLRRQSKVVWSIERLEQAQFISAEQAQWLNEQIKNKKNLLIIGCTGSGKTSLINGCLQKVAKNERVLCIEDTSELVCPNEASSKLLTRTDTRKQLTNYDQNDLLRQTLRMRPDRLVLGEIRGEEAKDFLLLLSTGHRGSLSSLHASSAREALWRLEMLVQMATPQWSLNTIRRLIALSLHYIVFVEKADGFRKVHSAHEIKSYEENIGFVLSSIFEDSNTSLNLI